MKEEVEEMDEFKETKVPYLKLASGFKEGDGETPSDNWLLNLPLGAVFLALKKGEHLIEEYELHWKFDNAVKVYYSDHRGQGWLWLHPGEFVKRYIFIRAEIFRKDDDGSSRLGDDATAEEGHPET